MLEKKTRFVVTLRPQEKKLLEELASEYGLSLSRFVILRSMDKLKPFVKGEE
jgi:hypothetical protein